VQERPDRVSGVHSHPHLAVPLSPLAGWPVSLPVGEQTAPYAGCAAGFYMGRLAGRSRPGAPPGARRPPRFRSLA
jgi:hypothetical protein